MNMKKQLGAIFPSAILFACTAALSPLAAQELRLAENGKARYGIVLGGEPASHSEQFAYLELREFLDRSIGAVSRNAQGFAPRMVFEGQQGQRPRNIYLGWTDFARANGVEPESLGPEEYLIRTVGDDIMIVGGRPRGTLYGVYDFLGNQVGVIFATPTETVVPEKPNLAVSADLDIRREPQIALRGFSRVLGSFLPDWDQHYANILWRVRNRENHFNEPDVLSASPPLWTSRQYFARRKDLRKLGLDIEDLPEADFHKQYPLWRADYFGGFERNSQAYHNSFRLLPPEDWQKTNPEFFSMKNGKWMKNLTADDNMRGELNYSNRESRPIVARNLIDHIEEVRLTNRRLGQQEQALFRFNQMDSHDASDDPETRRLIREKYGAHSGVMLEYVNEVADAVAGKYPEVMLQTLAYIWTMEPPRNIRAAENVLIQWCNWNGGSAYGLPDHTRSLTHPDLDAREQSLRRWAELTDHLGIWDYYYLPTDYPTTNLNRMAGDFPLFGELDVELMFVQIDNCEDDGLVAPWARGQFFFELETWVAYRLMDDPKADVDDLVRRFVEAYYGAAAEPVWQAIQLLREGDLLERRPVLGWTSWFFSEFGTFKYLNPGFYAEMAIFLGEAAAAVAHDPERANRVRRLRIKLDMSLLVFWDQIASRLPPDESMPIERDEAFERLQRTGFEVIESDIHDPRLKTLMEQSFSDRMERLSRAYPKK